MVSKASLESLARTMSVAALAATTFLSVQHMTTPPAIAVTSDAAVYIGTVKTVADRSEQRASRSFRYPLNAQSAPKDVEARGYWVKDVLQEVGFRGQSLKEAWAIVMRESTGRPLAYNGNQSTGDSSYGLFQINMIGSLGPDRRDKFGITANRELFDPVTNAKAAYYMSNGGENWSAWEPYNGGHKEKGFRKWLSQYPN